VSAPLQLVVHRTDPHGHAVELSMTVPSDLALVGDVVDLVAKHCHGGPLPARRVFFNLRTVLAEALTNAITYGNRGDPSRQVRIRVEVAADAVRLHVTDEGDGFDADSIPDPTVPENLSRENGRGLFVMRHLVDQVSFNKKGNGVCLTLRAP
jgi:signal transduction histidine kinase